MAAAKKKAVKRPAKTAAKPVNKAAQASQAAWQQQSAKLLPFAQADMTDAAEAARSATESMMRMSSDAMQQWWSAAQSAAAQAPQASLTQKASARANDIFSHAALGRMPGLDLSQAQEQVTKVARETAEHLNKAAASTGKAMNEAMSLSRENGEALMAVANITVSLSKELGAELISYANRSFAQNVELSKQVLACRTLNDMFDLSSRFMKSNLDAFFSESVKLSELLFQASTDVSEPLNERFSASSERLSKALVA